MSSRLVSINRVLFKSLTIQFFSIGLIVILFVINSIRALAITLPFVYSRLQIAYFFNKLYFI